ncbi:DUF58 domain-containing protein [Euzebya tangerina]|uniref:DUF58 domain-containing protein n=1 Tax=Euzebya tangerina TaxID=591198 RepID=UPI000E317A63|nr:DUF58 domain-containing protein [Euzebya tangerina]
MGWASAGLSVVLYLAGSNIGSGWIVMLAAALVAAPALDLVTAAVTSRHTNLAISVSGPPRVGGTRLRVQVTRPAGVTSLRISAADGESRGTVRGQMATITGVATLPRGVHDAVSVRAETVGPLGLAVARRRHQVATNRLIGPSTLPCPVRVRTGIAGVEADRAAGHADDEIASIRPFVQGDPRRLVHWRSTARHGQVMVREHIRVGGGGQLLLVMDGGTWTQEAADLACTVLASLAEQATADGHDVLVAIDGSLITWEAGSIGTLAAVPPAHGVPARPLDMPPAVPNPPAVTLRCRDGHLIVLASSAPDVQLDSMQEVRAWLQP